ncbi:MAG: tetratricopeptide repeat protein [Rhizobiaceae bacterium]
MSCLPQGIIGFGHFLIGRHEDAVLACQAAVEMNPGFSMLHAWMAAPLTRLGKIDEARAAAARLLALDPQFSVGRWSACVGIAPTILDQVTDALRLAGLPD